MPSSADILRARYASRLPSTLADLAGPAQGRVDLPLHVAWSGPRGSGASRSPTSLRARHFDTRVEAQRVVYTFDCLVNGYPGSGTHPNIVGVTGFYVLELTARLS